MDCLSACTNMVASIMCPKHLRSAKSPVLTDPGITQWNMNMLIPIEIHYNITWTAHPFVLQPLVMTFSVMTYSVLTYSVMMYSVLKQLLIILKKEWWKCSNDVMARTLHSVKPWISKLLQPNHLAISFSCYFPEAPTQGHYLFSSKLLCSK